MWFEYEGVFFNLDKMLTIRIERFESNRYGFRVVAYYDQEHSIPLFISTEKGCEDYMDAELRGPLAIPKYGIASLWGMERAVQDILRGLHGIFTDKELAQRGDVNAVMHRIQDVRMEFQNA